MKKSKFGYSQLWKDTPLYIKRIRLGVLTFIGGALMYMPQLSRWTGISSEDLDAIFGITLLTLTSILSMFGQKTDEEIQSAKKKAGNSNNLVGPRPGDR